MSVADEGIVSNNLIQLNTIPSSTTPTARARILAGTPKRLFPARFRLVSVVDARLVFIIWVHWSVRITFLAVSPC